MPDQFRIERAGRELVVEPGERELLLWIENIHDKTKSGEVTVDLDQAQHLVHYLNSYISTQPIRRSI